MRVIINGAAGRMGQELRPALTARGHEVVAAVDIHYQNDPAAGQYQTLDGFLGDADCIIDFSNHAATPTLLTYAMMRALPPVIATTGHTAEESAAVAAAAKKIPIFMAPNMSIGIALLAELAQRAVAVFPDADVEIVEVHHNQKLDVPSGTALLLASRIREERPEAEFNIGRHTYGKRRTNEIGIHSLRMGAVCGQHEVLISTASQTIRLAHELHSRAPLAEGAVAAAEFITTMPAGLYGMTEMLAAGGKQ